MKRLEGKVAIITGAGTGIGEAIARKFSKEGARVVIAGFPDDPVDDVVRAIEQDGGSAMVYKGDLSHQSDAENCVKATVEQFGKLDILINNAGVFSAAAELQDYPVEAFENMLKNNIKTCFHMSRAAIKQLQKTKGCIVSAGSESGIVGIAQVTPYGGTKAWIHAFMKGLAVEQAKYGVRCNCVCPGAVDTAWTHKETGPFDASMEQLVLNATPMGRRGTPEEIANVYLFLASDEASYVTGSLYRVDGGIVIAKGGVGKQAGSDVKSQPDGELALDHAMDGKPEKLR